MSKKATDAIFRNVFNMELKLKSAMTQVSTQIEIELQAAILRICTETVCNDSDALLNVAPCRALLHNCVTNFCRCLPDKTSSVAGFIADTTVVELERAEEVELDKVCGG